MIAPSFRGAARVALALVLAAPSASARCLVRPSPDGAFSTWLVTGPHRLGALTPRPSWEALFQSILSDPSRGPGVPVDALHPSASGTAPTWRPAASNRAWLDVGAAVGGRGARVAFAGVTLRVTRAGRRTLLLGTDDAMAVWLDGRELARSTRPRESLDDLDVVPLDLTAGEHRLVVKLASRGDLDLFARLVDDSLSADPDVQIALADVDDATCDQLAGRAASIALTRRALREGVGLRVDVTFPGGSAMREGETSRELRFEWTPSTGAAITRTATFTAPDTVRFEDLVRGDAQGSALVRVGSASQRFTVRVDPTVRAALVRASEVLPPLDPAYGDDAPLTLPAPPHATDALPAGSIWSVERTAERLAGLVAEADADAAHQLAEARWLNELLDDLAAGRDPYARRTGAIRRAYRSPLDGALQEYSVYIPPSYRRDRAMPLVMGLHGLHGTAHRMLPILTGFYDEDEPRTHADRWLPPMPETRAIFVAPYGYGDAAYRQQGEYDVLRVLDEVRAAYRIDEARTYMTGLSMGGIGAAWVPFHHPDVFAAVASLCGYHSYFVRQDTRGARRPWEVFLMELRSNAHYAENGLHTPLYVVQGTLDRPITNSTVLTERYTQLGYTLRSEFPTLDHNVWSTTYADGRIVPYFTQYTRERAPRTLRFRTPELRWNRAWWLTVDALTGPHDGVTQRTGHWGDVTLDTRADGTGTGTTQGVAALTLTPPREGWNASARALTLTLDGDRVTAPFDTATSFVREGGHWRAGPRVTARAGGTIREVFDTPMLFVVGTGDGAEVRANERMARHLAVKSSVRARYAIVRDDAYTEAMGAGRTLVLVGRSNRLLARWADRLPIRVDASGVTVGERRFAGDDVGAMFTAPNPDDPTRVLLVVAGATPLATLRARALPDLLPEYVVFDRRVEAARGRVILGAEASVLDAGWFDDRGAAIPASQAIVR